MSYIASYGSKIERDTITSFNSEKSADTRAQILYDYLVGDWTNKYPRQEDVAKKIYGDDKEKISVVNAICVGYNFKSKPVHNGQKFRLNGRFKQKYGDDVTIEAFKDFVTEFPNGCLNIYFEEWYQTWKTRDKSIPITVNTTAKTINDVKVEEFTSVKKKLFSKSVTSASNVSVYVPIGKEKSASLIDVMMYVFFEALSICFVGIVTIPNVDKIVNNNIFGSIIEVILLVLIYLLGILLIPLVLFVIYFIIKWILQKGLGLFKIYVELFDIQYKAIFFILCLIIGIVASLMAECAKEYFDLLNFILITAPFIVPAVISFVTDNHIIRKVACGLQSVLLILVIAFIYIPCQYSSIFAFILVCVLMNIFSWRFILELQEIE